MTSADLDVLLATADDFELCDGLYSRFAECNNQIDVNGYTEEERVVTLVWYSAGTIGNGGFEYLFARSFKGDDGFLYTAAAFKIIGAFESYAAFQRALGAYSRRYPSDPERGIAAFNRLPESERTSINTQFWDDEQNMCSCLARYIRERTLRFRQLLAAPSFDTFPDDNRHA